MSKKYDLSGQIFGKLKVIEKTVNDKNKKKQTYWKCLCDCGNYTVVSTTDLLSGKIQQCCECGHYTSNYGKRKNYVGEKIGRLTVVEMIHPDRNDKKSKTKARCKCECGNEIIRFMDSLIIAKKNKSLTSCGCAKKEVAMKSCGKNIDGQKFGRLTVVKTLWEERPPKVLCKCDCGTEKLFLKSDVQDGHTQSCGCLQRERTGNANFVDSSGFISDSGIEIIKPHHQNEKSQWVWECKCGYCERIFYEIPARIKNNHVQSCGCINTSMREDFIEKLLNEYEYTYATQYTFPNCKYKYVLRFDFAIFNEQNKLLHLLEYDGEQHYKPIELFGGEETFEETQYRDQIKNEYCKNNNIDLIRLPYFLSNDEIRDIIINIKKA